jgi:hypothetical protein
VRELKFDETPDYKALKRPFREMLFKKGYSYDFEYDWCHQAANDARLRGDSEKQPPATAMKATTTAAAGGGKGGKGKKSSPGGKKKGVTIVEPVAVEAAVAVEGAGVGEDGADGADPVDYVREPPVEDEYVGELDEDELEYLKHVYDASNYGTDNMADVATSVLASRTSRSTYQLGLQQSYPKSRNPSLI